MNLPEYRTRDGSRWAPKWWRRLESYCDDPTLVGWLTRALRIHRTDLQMVTR